MRHMMLTAALLMTLTHCTAKAVAEVPRPGKPVVKLGENPNDSLPYGLTISAVSGATGYRWTVTANRSLGPLPTDQQTVAAAISFIVAKPGTPTTVDSVTFTATVKACNGTNCSAPSGPTIWKFVRKLATPPVPGPIIVDSSQVPTIGLIAIPESVSLYQVAHRTIVKTPTTCTTEPSGPSYPCDRDMAYDGCMYYMNGGNFQNNAPPIAHAKQVTWPDQFGNPQHLGGVAYDVGGRPYQQCVGILPVLCIEGDMSDGSHLLTQESFAASPNCRKQLFGNNLGVGYWVFADTTRVITTSPGKFEQVIAYRGNHINEPIGNMNPGQIGYALLRAGPAYSVGLVPVLQTIDVPLGAKIERAIYLRMSDGSVVKQVDPTSLTLANSPGLLEVEALTPFGRTVMHFNVISPLRMASRQ